MNNNIQKTYKKNGYIISESLFNDEQIKLLRNELENEFVEFDKSKGFTLEINQIKNEKLTNYLINILNSDKIQNICHELEKLCNKPVSLLPTFHVHKNYHVNSWKFMVGIEMQGENCHMTTVRKKLYKESYLFSKVGIYLQNNTDYGGGIDIIIKTHKNFTPLKTIVRKILNIPFRIITFIHNTFLKLYYIIPENFLCFY